MANYFERIQYLYPGIQRVSYWYAQYDGTAWSDPYEGIVWENSEITKPSKETLDALDDATVNTELANRAYTTKIDNLVIQYQNDIAVKVGYNFAKQSNSSLAFRDYVIQLDSQIVS